jgi:hypothetical protein
MLRMGYITLGMQMVLAHTYIHTYIHTYRMEELMHAIITSSIQNGRTDACHHNIVHPEWKNYGGHHNIVHPDAGHHNIVHPEWKN